MEIEKALGGSRKGIEELKRSIDVILSNGNSEWGYNVGCENGTASNYGVVSGRVSG